MSVASARPSLSSFGVKYFRRDNGLGGGAGADGLMLLAAVTTARGLLLDLRRPALPLLHWPHGCKTRPPSMLSLCLWAAAGESQKSQPAPSSSPAAANQALASLPSRTDDDVEDDDEESQGHEEGSDDDADDDDDGENDMGHVEVNIGGVSGRGWALDTQDDLAFASQREGRDAGGKRRRVHWAPDVGTQASQPTAPLLGAMGRRHHPGPEGGSGGGGEVRGGKAEPRCSLTGLVVYGNCGEGEVRSLEFELSPSDYGFEVRRDNGLSQMLLTDATSCFIQGQLSSPLPFPLWTGL